MNAISDEAMAKYAADQNFVPLTQTFGVKLADSEAILSKVSSDAFFDNLAHHGIVPRSPARLSNT